MTWLQLQWFQAWFLHIDAKLDKIIASQGGLPAADQAKIAALNADLQQKTAALKAAVQANQP